MAEFVIPLYFNLDTFQFTDGLTGSSRAALTIGQSDVISWPVRFVRSGVAVELANTPVFTCGLKLVNAPSSAFLVQTTTGVQTGTGSSTVYTFTTTISSSELDTQLNLASAVNCGFVIYDSANGIATLPSLKVTVLPNPNISGSAPTSANGTWSLAAGKTFTVSNTITLTGTDGLSANLDRLANLATNKVLGRTTPGTGAVEELPISGTGSVAMTDSPTFTGTTIAEAIIAGSGASTDDALTGSSGSGAGLWGQASTGYGAFASATASGGVAIFGDSQHASSFRMKLRGTTGSDTVVANDGSISGVPSINGITITAGGSGTLTMEGNINTGAAGGSIYLQNGGGTIDLRGTGSIEFGVTTTRTTLTGSATADRAIALPNADGTIALVTKKRTFIPASDILLYNSGGFASFSAQGTTFQGAFMPDAANTMFQILLDPAEWGGRAAKVTVVFVGNVSSTANVNFDVGLDWKTTAIDGATNSMAGPGWGAGGGSPVQNLNQAGPATQPYPQQFTSQQWNITAGATFLSLWLKRNGTTDAYAGNISVLWISIDEQ